MILIVVWHFTYSYRKIKHRRYALFYKDIDFPAQAEYPYFSADFRLKYSLWIFLDHKNTKWTKKYKRTYKVDVVDTTLGLYYHDGVEVILKPDCSQ